MPFWGPTLHCTHADAGPLRVDPFFLDAYWYRYQIYLLALNLDLAMRDLDTITDKNKNQYPVFDAKARLYQALELNRLAIVNFSSCIKIRPRTWDPYFQRGCLFDAEGDHTYAKEDFRVVREFEPSNDHAIYKLGIYSFQGQIWTESIRYWTLLIEHNSENGRAFVYRGRAYAQLARWEDAIQDLLRAIRIMPYDFAAFYHRGCLLRDRDPQQALRDFSVSLLLEDSELNIESYNHRAVLYVRQGNFERATDDYLRVLALDPTRYAVSLNLGILSSKFSHNDELSLQHFNSAIERNPTQARAYLCRADLYHKMHQNQYNLPLGKKKVNYLALSIRDHSRAIHVSPSDHMIYLYRGRLLLKQGKIQDATDDFRSAFELNPSIAQTFVQRALVLSFQGRYAQLLGEFENMELTKTASRDAVLLILVAKAKMKLKDYAGALENLAVAVRYAKREPKVYLQRGICLESMGDFAAGAK